MLNYISAEFYKLRRKKGLFVGTILLMLLESVVVIPNFWVMEGQGIHREALYGFFAIALIPMLLLPPLFAVAAFDDQYGHGTLKNEVVYGIPRTRSYVGKLIAGAAAGTVAAAVVSGWYVLLAQMFSRFGIDESMSLGWLLRVLLANWCLWLGVLAFTFLLLNVTKSTSVALALVYLITIFWGPVSLMAWEGDRPLWFRLSTELFYTAPLRFTISEGGGRTGLLLPMLGQSSLAYAAVVGAFWVVGCTALGLMLLRRREIK